MPQIIIETTPEEREAVLKAIAKLEGQVVPVRVIALEAKLSQSRARYALVDLITADKIERIAAKAFNKHYVRYYYKLK